MSATVTSTIVSRSATVIDSSAVWMSAIPFARFTHGRPASLKTFASAAPPLRANVGVIHGGTAGNIVPEWCTFIAEARSHDERKLADLVQEMLDAITFAAGVSECEVETTVQKSYRGYRFRRDELAVRLAAAALEQRGFAPTYALSGGAADANVFNERGLPCVNLANGMANIHTSDESIAVSDLEDMVEVTLALVDVAAEAEPPAR